MQKLFFIFLFTFSTIIYSQNTLSISYEGNLSSPYQGILPKNYLDTVQESSTPSNQRKEFDYILLPFQQKRYFSFLRESKKFTNKHSTHPYTNQLIWLQAHSYLQLTNYTKAIELLSQITNISDNEIKHRALLDLYQVHYQQKNLPKALEALEIIHNSAIDAPFKELAHMKYVYTSLLAQSTRKANILLDSFEQLYPNSIYLQDLQYFMALNDIKNGAVSKAKRYAKSILEKSTNTAIQKLLGEIELQDGNYEEALNYFFPISQYPNKYQDEALFKSAILFKYLQKILRITSGIELFGNIFAKFFVSLSCISRISQS